MINSFKKVIKDNKIELFYITFLIIFLLVISIPRLFTQYSIGIGNWDTYLYLENARSFASMGWGDVASISPVVPYILSLFFRIINSTPQEAIFNLSVLMYIVGTVSLYLIFRFKFNHMISYVGSIIYATFTLLYSWVAIGGNDITGVSLTLLTIYLILLAHEKNNKYYYIAMPIAAFAFLSRYTAGVMIFAIIFYLLINKISKNEFKTFIKGSVLGVLCVSPFLYHFYRILSTPFPFLGQFSGTVNNTKVLDAGYLPDTMYYIKHIPNYITSYIPHTGATFENVVNPMGNIPSVISYVFIILCIIGIFLIFYNSYKYVIKSNRRLLTGNNQINIIIALILTIICLISINSVSYIITTILTLSVLYIIKHILEDYDIWYLNYDLLMLSLLLVYIIFQSILSTKNDRYFITVLPFIAYFITNALYYIYNFIDFKIEIKNIKISTIISIVIVLFLLGNSLCYNNNIPEENHFNNIQQACKWFDDNCEFDNTTVIYSDNWPAVSWYLNVYCRRGVPDVTMENTTWTFTKNILKSNDEHEPASFYIDTNNENKMDYVGLSKIKSINDVQIYQNTYEKEYNIRSRGLLEYKDYYNMLFKEHMNESDYYD